MNCEGGGDPAGAPVASSSEPGPPDRSGRAVARFRAAIGIATVIMLGLSWPLWGMSRAFPRVPFVTGLPEPSVPVAWAIYGLLIVSILTAAMGIAWKLGLGLSVALLSFLVLGDQHRFQPWVYQYLIVAILVMSLPPRLALKYARWWFISIYAYSALSKLDRSFFDELGPVFLDAGGRALGIATDSWPAFWRFVAVLAMPLGELGIAIALVFPAWRRLALAGALFLHLILLEILGRSGLSHSTIVQIWNLAMMVDVAILFGPRPQVELGPPPATTRGAALLRAAFWSAMILPLGERWGILDSWPAHALYASHSERTSVKIHEEDIDSYPESILRHCSGAGEWRRLDLTGWSREVRGVPVYPQGRACNGLAEALAVRYRGFGLIEVVQSERAGFFSGRRAQTASFGLEAIQRQGDRYWFNAHPEGTFSP